MKTVYLLVLVVSFGATVYFIDTPSELLFNVLYSNLLALMGVGLYKLCDWSGLWDDNEEEN
ncbi:hypothetical protein CN926_00935 [Bacillus thuringiensis]|jgi:hypothetical protein|uniref:hypothetical protein n=1 Tax=Bacillus cereus group TaxID=86661 RepID=UPI000BFA5BB5|nr:MULTISPECIES: hypothetical protein [Bacillus cereus group]MCU5407951.1 hypothetical protein [Bacillus cereus]MCU5510253.1 hypothetical protein [Bacillus cereus]PFK68257.1 hypothetical protein COJ25_17120 [Bacillus cereus]PGL88599.1 hypothetical protein CN926_00935 [Bacillus thuringiensis]PGM47415.1 hypothetical protein CN937_03850 [Bacillus thuringiensis]